MQGASSSRVQRAPEQRLGDAAGLRKVEDELHVSAGAAVPLRVRSEVREQLERVPVVAQDERDEALDSLVAGPFDEPFEQRGGGAAALPSASAGSSERM